MTKWAIIKDDAVDSVLDRPQTVTIDGITYPMYTIIFYANVP